MDSKSISIAKTHPIRDYILLAKPGIIMGNAITAAAGFALASKGSFDGWLLCTTLIGLSLIIGSACVFNNYIDRYADEKMDRTKHRALVVGAISSLCAIRYALLLGGLGVTLLSIYTNALTVWAALLGFSVYVFLYSFWKYRTSYATLIGSIAGAMPPVAGYFAASCQLDIGAMLLFLILTFWQMPHFFALALYRCQDYVHASIPVLPAKRGAHATKIQIFFYIIAFAVAAISPSFFQLTGKGYLMVASLLSITWISLSIRGFWPCDTKRWARQMFLFSLLAIIALSLAIVLEQIF